MEPSQYQDLLTHAENMRKLAIGLLGRAIHDVVWGYGEDDELSPIDYSQSVVLAAQGAEVWFKACLLQTELSSLFLKPMEGLSTWAQLENELSRSKTVAFSQLPLVVKRVLGIDLPLQFGEFGERRNRIVHAGVISPDDASATLKFCVEVMEPNLQRYHASAIPSAMHWEITAVNPSDLRAALNDLDVKITPPVDQELREIENTYAK